mmetsp:Transcript_6512/g.21866  ORF Transcript_6512/g.21866 Transcript_6512/m.21866 type:complete len:210 (-) Transcript_6512:424-1053(-)
MRCSRRSATLSASISRASIADIRTSRRVSCTSAISRSRSAHSASSHSCISCRRRGRDSVSLSGGRLCSNNRFARIFRTRSTSAADSCSPVSYLLSSNVRTSGRPSGTACFSFSALCRELGLEGSTTPGAYGTVCASLSRKSDCVPSVRDENLGGSWSWRRRARRSSIFCRATFGSNAAVREKSCGTAVRGACAGLPAKRSTGRTACGGR